MVAKKVRVGKRGLRLCGFIDFFFKDGFIEILEVN